MNEKEARKLQEIKSDLPASCPPFTPNMLHGLQLLPNSLLRKLRHKHGYGKSLPRN